MQSQKVPDITQIIKQQTMKPGTNASTPSNINVAYLSSQHPENCGVNCKCMKCQILNYSLNIAIDNLDEELIKGPILVRNHLAGISEMVGEASLTYKLMWNYQMKEVTKIKCNSTSTILGLRNILLTLKVEGSPERVTVNQCQFSQWFTKIILSKLGVLKKFGVPFHGFDGKFQGQIYINHFIKGWTLTNIHITNSRLRTEAGKEVYNIKQLWTRFQFIDKGTPCLIIKFKDGIIKVEYALPLNRLSELLMAFSSLVKE